jgi:hypothetical protein
MGLLGRLLGIGGDDSSDDDDDFNNRDNGAGESGSKHGRHNHHVNPHPAHIYDEETGLTKHERAVLEQYLVEGNKDAAKTLGMNRTTFNTVLSNAKAKLDWYGDRNDLYRQFKEEYGAPTGYTGETDYSTSADHTHENYTDPTTEGGDHPWMYDGEGNRIG